MIVKDRPKRAVRGITILIWRKMARRGRESKMDPKPESPWIKPEKKAIRQISK